MGKAVHQESGIDPQVAATRNKLFQQYIAPHYEFIYALCGRYSYHRDNVEENYTEVLTNLYWGIETYNPAKSLTTWIHVVTKRHIFRLEKHRTKQKNRIADNRDADYLFADDCVSEDDGRQMNVDNYREFYSDDVLVVLEEMSPIFRNALLMQEAGYSLKEIAEIEHANGNLRSKNIETVKSRLFLARKFLKSKLTRDGKRRSC